MSEREYKQREDGTEVGLNNFLDASNTSLTILDWALTSYLVRSIFIQEFTPRKEYWGLIFLH